MVVRRFSRSITAQVGPGCKSGSDGVHGEPEWGAYSWFSEPIVELVWFGYKTVVIRQLTIQHMAVVDHIVVSLDQGLTIITGESGVGKSIVVDAIGLLCGAPCKDDVIRSGEEMALVEGVLDATRLTGDWSEWVSPHVTTVVIERVIKRKGGHCRINGVSVSLKTLRTLAPHWLSMVGQHDQLAVFDPSAQLTTLDSFDSTISRLYDAYADTYRSWASVTKRLADMRQQDDDRDQQLAFLSYQLDDLNALHPLEDEEGILTEKKRALAAQLQDKTTLLSLMDRLEATIQSVAAIEQAVQKCHHDMPPIDGVRSTLDTLATHLWQTTHSLQSVSEADLDRIEERLDQLFKAKTKYKVLTTLALVEKWRDIQARYDALSQHQQEWADCQALSEQLTPLLYDQAAALTQARHACARQLSRAVTPLLHRLGLPHATFDCQWTPTEPYALGMDKVEWMVTINPGEAAKPLRKAASGGELSRVMLAIHAAMVTRQVSPTIVLDEIDTGVGGVTAIAIGELVGELAQYAQVLCVTHLAQIAQFATHHIRIEKHVRDGVTVTTAHPLSMTDRQAELKRMIGGDQLLHRITAYAVESPHP